MARGRDGVRTAVLPVVLLALCYLVLELGPDLLGRPRLPLLTRPPVLEPVRLVSVGLLEVVMPLAVAAGVLVLLRRTAGRPAVRRRAVGVLAGAIGSAELLKWLLPAIPATGARLVLPGHGSYPSGHTAAAVAIALLLHSTGASRAGPARPALGPVVAWTVAVAATTVTAQWHRPAEALGGALLAAAWHRALPARPDDFPDQGLDDGADDGADPGVLAWWGVAAAPGLLAVAASWGSVHRPVHRVLPHLVALLLLAVAVGAVTVRAAAARPAAPSG
jgi:membrane-associated phospholipid phosphatase